MELVPRCFHTVVRSVRPANQRQTADQSADEVAAPDDVVTNGRGNGALKKIGAVAEGRLRRSLSIRQGLLDQILWAAIDEDWHAAHPEPFYRLVVEEAQAPELEPPAGSEAPAASWRLALPPAGDDTVSLRELQVGDAPRLLEVLSEPQATEFVLPPPPTPGHFEPYIGWTHRQREAGATSGSASCRRASDTPSA